MSLCEFAAKVEWCGSSSYDRAMVSVPFHQIMRSTCPIVTILLYRAFYARTYSTATYLSIIPLVLGVALATFGDYSFTILGFACTLLGVVLASVKVCALSSLDTPRPGVRPPDALAQISLKQHIHVADTKPGSRHEQTHDRKTCAICFGSPLPDVAACSHPVFSLRCIRWRTERCFCRPRGWKDHCIIAAVSNRGD